MTWPRDRRLLPPLIRIDHVLTTRGWTVTGLRTGHGQGSDHGRWWPTWPGPL